MSRPGYWKSGGVEIPYAQMEESHVKHALRYLRNKLIEFRGAPSTNNASYRAYCEQKLIELGNEAQRRNIIPQGDVTQEQLEIYITTWQTEWDNRPRNIYYRASIPQQPVVPQNLSLATPVTYNSSNQLNPSTLQSPQAIQPAPVNGRWMNSSERRRLAREQQHNQKQAELANKNQRVEVDLNDRQLDTDL